MRRKTVAATIYELKCGFRKKHLNKQFIRAILLLVRNLFHFSYKQKNDPFNSDIIHEKKAFGSTHFGRADQIYRDTSWIQAIESQHCRSQFYNSYNFNAYTLLYTLYPTYLHIYFDANKLEYMKLMDLDRLAHPYFVSSQMFLY